jgi:hypothetical protein
MVVLAGANCFAGVRLGGAGEDRHAAGRLVGDDLDDPPTLFDREAHEFAGRSVRIESVHPLGDQPIDIAPQFALVDLAARVERDDVRSEYAANGLRHRRVNGRKRN